jgi:hypothetical protein
MKKIFLFIILICVTLSLTSKLFSYKELYVVDNAPQKINRKADFKSDNLEELINESLRITLRDLSFSLKSGNNSNVNDMYKTKKAHCVGYASFFATTCNYLLKKYHLGDRWTAKPQIGQIYFMGTNIHKYFESSFFKDHDFVTIENETTGEIFAVDPTMNDYFHIDFIVFNK